MTREIKRITVFNDVKINGSRNEKDDLTMTQNYK